MTTASTGSDGRVLLRPLILGIAGVSLAFVPAIRSVVAQAPELHGWDGGSKMLGAVNFITFLASISVLGGGIWLASWANIIIIIGRHPLPAVAHHHHRARRHGRLPHGLRRRLLPPDLAAPHLPLRHVLHRLCLRHHRPRGGPGGHEPPLPRVPALRLQRMAPQPRRQPGVLDHHQHLPPRRPRLPLHETPRPRPQHRHARPRATQHVLWPRPLPDSGEFCMWWHGSATMGHARHC